MNPLNLSQSFLEDAPSPSSRRRAAALASAAQPDETNREFARTNGPDETQKPETPGVDRSRRKRLVKARTISTRGPLEGGSVADFSAYQELESTRSLRRPLTRSECANSVRPCPYVSCRYHLYLEVSPKTGSLKLNFPDLEVWDLVESCALDVADRGAQSTENLGELLNLTPERARQLEQDALRRVASSLDRQPSERMSGTERSPQPSDRTGSQTSGTADSTFRKP